MTFRFIVSLMLFSLLALRLSLCWSQALPGADGDVAIHNAAVETVLYSFAEDVNGAYPLSRVLRGGTGACTARPTFLALQEARSSSSRTHDPVFGQSRQFMISM
jgi:hypothetical protein